MRRFQIVLLIAASCGAATAARSAAPSPHYVTIVHEVEVDRPAATVWSKVGGYCDLSKWLGKSCDIVSGHGNDIGATREIDGQIIEVLVGKTRTSYTYSQPEMQGSPTHFYHGTLDVEPVTAGSSRIVYTLFYDNSGVPAADRAKELGDRSALFLKAVTTMKQLALKP